MVLNILCQSRPVVAHCNLDFLAPSDRTDGDLRTRRRRGGIERVYYEIQHDLQKLNGIAGDRQSSLRSTDCSGNSSRRTSARTRVMMSEARTPSATISLKISL